MVSDWTAPFCVHIFPISYGFVPGIAIIPWKYHQNPFRTFWDILQTHRRTDRQTDRQTDTNHYENITSLTKVIISGVNATSRLGMGAKRRRVFRSPPGQRSGKGGVPLPRRKSSVISTWHVLVNCEVINLKYVMIIGGYSHWRPPSKILGEVSPASPLRWTASISSRYWLHSLLIIGSCHCYTPDLWEKCVVRKSMNWTTKATPILWTLFSLSIMSCGTLPRSDVWPSIKRFDGAA